LQIALRNFCDFVKNMQFSDFLLEFAGSNPGAKTVISQSEKTRKNSFAFFDFLENALQI